MKSFSFSYMILIGLALSALGVITFHCFNSLMHNTNAAILSCLSILFFYLVTLLKNSTRSTGQMTGLSILIVTNFLLGALLASAEIILISNMFALWILRSLFLHRHILAIGVDAGLVILGTVSATYVWAITHNGFVSFWTFFLIQSFIVFVPQLIERRLSLLETRSSLINTSINNNATTLKRDNGFNKQRFSAAAKSAWENLDQLRQFQD